MRALVLTDFGNSPELTDLDLPEPAEGEVRVRVRAASVNGFDIAVANSYLQGMMEHRFPVVVGKDFAGTVDAVGPGVTDYQIGDRVFGAVTKPYLGDGSFAEYVTVPTAVGIAVLPETIDFVTGAALAWPGRPRSQRSTPPPCSPAKPSWSPARPAAWATRWSSWPLRPGPTSWPPPARTLSRHSSTSERPRSSTTPGTWRRPSSRRTRTVWT